jgi:hypothetical protein
MENTIVGIPFFHMKIIIPNIWQFPIYGNSQLNYSMGDSGFPKYEIPY